MLSLAVASTGPGRVTSQPVGIDCGTVCAQGGILFNTQETLTATPNPGALFQQWTGDCAGQGPTCKLALLKNATTTAVFAQTQTTTTKTTTTATITTTTATTQTTTTAATTTAPTAASPIGARIVYATVTSTGGGRVLQVRVRVSESARVQIRLLQQGFERLHKLTTVQAGANQLTATLSRSLRKGTYQLELTLRDSRGNQKTYRATVLIPA
jgi:hypothetical protein